MLGITGTGGAGKSSLTDELIRRLRLDQDDSLRVAVISIDPSRRKSGGALLGDRIRMNAIGPWSQSQGPRVFMRSLATRDFGSEISAALPDVIAACKAAGFDLIVVETSGIGQGDAAIVPLVDVPMYVMTPEFGAASQLEKIDMLDFAEFVAINKFDRKGALDALRDVAKQVQRNKEAWGKRPDEMPVFGTMAARFNDDGVTALYQALKPRLARTGPARCKTAACPSVAVRHSTNQTPVVPAARTRYLAEISDTVRGYKQRAREQAKLAREIQQLKEAARMLKVDKPDRAPAAEAALDLAGQRKARMDKDALHLLQQWPDMQKAYAGDEYVVKIRDKEIRTALTTKSLSGTTIRKVSLPQYEDHGEILKWLMLDNVPGSYPYTAGTFAFKREGEDPTRMFAGEGDAFRTNKRFKLLSQGMPAKRLSTAFDSVTLYGNDPDPRPDIYGKVGNSGVSIATLEDMKVLYSGFDLCSPSTSVSMTINGPAPTILAMFMNTAIDQNLEKFKADNGREPTDTEAAKIREWVLANVRGTVQADILKEDQGQNTCIFSTEFSLKVMGDIARVLRAPQRAQLLLGVDLGLSHRRSRRQPDQPAGVHAVQRLHLRRSLPGARHAHRRLRAQPVVLLLQRHGPGVHGDGPGGPPHLGGGDEGEVRRQRAQPEAQVPHPDFGPQPARPGDPVQRHPHHAAGADRDLRQLQLAAHQRLRRGDHHAHRRVSVRRAMAIQLIINREWGLAKNENPSQGAFIIEELTELVEEAVLAEFERIAERGGVLGAMETGYQRGRIQDESMHYEMLKHTGELPIVGVNTFRNPHGDTVQDKLELARSTEEEKQSQLKRLQDFHARNARQSPGHAQAPAAGRHRQPQRVRGADGRGAGVLARPDHRTHCSKSAGSTGVICSSGQAFDSIRWQPDPRLCTVSGHCPAAGAPARRTGRQ